MAREYPTIIDLVGSTPIVRLDRVSRDVPGTILAKLEFLNPGGSNKDRIGLAMIEAAERDGKLKPGGTIVEPTSGNTGVGLAIAAAQKGYRCIFVMPDKMSQEKISMLRGYGAEVVITPTAVDHDSPESYYSVSSRLAEEIPGGFKPDQYSNMANPEAHYETTAPEIWEQTGGELDAIVITVGTGGTISGVGRYFNERKPTVKIVGVDPEGSIYTAKSDADLHPYLVEGIGKDTWPKTIDLTVVDEWIQVSDRDSFLAARRLAREEGLLVGGSSGSTIAAALRYAQQLGPDSQVLTILPDSGRSYLSKFLDDNWMIEHGFLERSAPGADGARAARAKPGDTPALVTISAHQKVAEAISVMERYSISQLPVVRDGDVASLTDVIGSLEDRALLDLVFKNADALHEDVAVAMQGPLAAVDADASVDEIVTALTGGTNAVVVADNGARSAWSRAPTCSSTSRAARHVAASIAAIRRLVVGSQGYTRPLPPRRRRRRRGDDPPADGGAARLDLDRRPRAPADADRAHRRVSARHRARPAARGPGLRVLGARGVAAPDRALAALSGRDGGRRPLGPARPRTARRTPISSSRCSSGSAPRGRWRRATSRGRATAACGTGSRRRWCSTRSGTRACS